ncbi:putative acyltransferase 3 [Plasmopara halstedii]
MLQSTSSSDTRNESTHTIIINEGEEERNITKPSSSKADEPQLRHEAEDTVSLSTSKGQVNPPAPERKTKVLFLTGTRGLAALLVVVHHSHDFMPHMHLQLGAIGVDLFFVLSSYLLTWILMQKIQTLIAQGASYRTWALSLIDYFQRRLFRVYPLFFVTVIVVSFLTVKDQSLYFSVDHRRPPYDIVKTLMFDFQYRYHVFWTLPLEIAYYFVIPIFVFVVIKLRCLWWIAGLLLTVWIVKEGIFTGRRDHQPLKLHISTFFTGSMAAVVFIKMDSWIKKTSFIFRWWHTLFLRTVESLAILMLLSVTFRGLVFTWVFENPFSHIKGVPYTSAYWAIIILIEMIKPSYISTMLEWNVLCTWGKFSFSIYLMHSFVVYNPVLKAQTNYFDRLFSRLLLIFALSATTYYLIEFPSLWMAKRVSRLITNAVKRHSSKWTKLAGVERIRTQE